MELYIIGLTQGNMIYGTTEKTYKRLDKAKEVCEEENNKLGKDSKAKWKVLKAEWYSVKEILNE